MPDELYYLSRGKLTHKQGLYSKISKMQLEADLCSKNRAPYYSSLPNQTLPVHQLSQLHWRWKSHSQSKRNGCNEKHVLIIKKILIVWCVLWKRINCKKENLNRKVDPTNSFSLFCWCQKTGFDWSGINTNPKNCFIGMIP